MKHAKAWGEEDWIVNTPDYCGKILTLRKGWQCSWHFHPVKHETFYLMSGLVQFEWREFIAPLDPHISGDIVLMAPGDRIEIKPQTIHRFTGLEDSVIVEFSTHHDEDDVVRLEPSRQVDDPADLVDLPRGARA
jgi:mannose-6-phosphate isomerase-like protein (cupin superfamily)